jgi:GNAT superfamily N-acetyltransferase
LAGNRCYLAHVGADTVAYGWVAGASAAIRELDVAFGLADADGYLWDFRTLPDSRGRGVYPRVLQSIPRAERLADTLFSISHAPENIASARGSPQGGFPGGGRPGVGP